MLAPKFPFKLLSILGDRCSRFDSLGLNYLGRLLLGLLALVGVLSLATPALAHHPLGGRLPANAFEGFLSGVAHPVIGLDHFAFVLAAGLIAATKRRGILIPVAFVLASLVGTGMHLMLWNLPAPEMIISASVLAFGAILALGDRLNLALVLSLGALAGIFHGYAYGEAIFGAEMSPLVAYLAGFATVQMAIALLFFAIGRSASKQAPSLPSLDLRFAGFTLTGVGLAFLSSAMLG
ncbi:MAG: HupE/UreJ family protein [Cyanobacteria bacterium P01_G01_bin.38]